MEVNDRPFTGEDPDTDVPMVEGIAGGDATREEIVAWLGRRTAASG